MKQRSSILLSVLTILLCVNFIGCSARISPLESRYHSDNGDGTFTNPVIASDFPDIDLIRVGDTYYLLATTMFIFPGVPVLKSKDLVNWEYCANTVPRIDDSECYNLDECNRYRHGQWASSLKYHNGKFYLLFNTLDDGGFMVTTEDPDGPWEMTHLPRGFHDPGLFFDDDGKIYVAWGYNEIRITPLDENFAPAGEDRLVYTGDLRRGIEGAHVYKLNGYYYLYCTYGGRDGFQVALRSKNIYGPYEQKIVLQDRRQTMNFGIHQGALVQTQTGEWWTMLFVDQGPFGRMPSLQPIRWEDDWPIGGVDGNAVLTYRKPDVGKKHPITELPTSDEFKSNELGMQWGWNHNPEPSKWSLSERPGHLRLHTVNVTSDFKMARNTLTQRLFAPYSSELQTLGTIKMDFTNMKDGDIAGLCVFQDPYAYIAIHKMNGKYRIVMVNNGEEIESVESVETDATTIYFRSNPFFGIGVLAHAAGVETPPGTSAASFYYSTDNKTYIKLGNELQMRFSLTIFTGNKFCLFNYATRELGGHVDFDWFKTEFSR